ncbi:MAG: hypothetical protein IPP57_09565 [Candidatus Obscuribacter sp.]|jgi:hypothetical protein|nr:hypothetical protein [Candidatus Obscuribacter sp.]MDQ5967247.1 hypothetical protein [Cyanobacteriota bacterium erpe_2018_sw_39hr_WHONDRS-SW48-000098_B_bin.30]MBK7837484.1 hypothetical protein [Candidatus Obscuribacter sp.]MBK9206300.1 hypothetical protein [Candidatus Obscuribacter sp.]MBK9618204.1 hypothetical protein [Candidatus Obscuribacter sp.]
MFKKIAHYLHSMPFFSKWLKKGGVEEADTIVSARMTNNRLHALDGHGHRQCYMDKLREVVHEQEPIESNKERWFGHPDHVNPEGPASIETSGSHGKARRSSTRLSQARITSTRLQAYQDSVAGRSAHGEARAIDEIDSSQDEI